MATYAPLTVGNLNYKILDLKDGVAFGRINLGTWQPISWTRDGVASTGVTDHYLVRTDNDRIAQEVYWIERADGIRTVKLTRPAPAENATILCSKSINLREGVFEIP